MAERRWGIVCDGGGGEGGVDETLRRRHWEGAMCRHRERRVPVGTHWTDRRKIPFRAGPVPECFAPQAAQRRVPCARVNASIFGDLAFVSVHRIVRGSVWLACCCGGIAASCVELRCFLLHWLAAMLSTMMLLSRHVTSVINTLDNWG